MSTRLVIRITGPLVAVSLLLLLMGVVAAGYMHWLQKKHSDILALNVSSMRAAEELEIGVREIRTQLVRFLLTGDRKYLDTVPRMREEVDRWLAEADRSATTPREQELMGQFRRHYELFSTQFDRVTQQPTADDLGARVQDLIDRLLTNEVLPPAHEYLDFNEEVMAKASTETVRPSPRLCWRASCSATNGRLSLEHNGAGSVSSSRPTAAPSSWTRLAT